ncbi:MAG TPA: ROK family protein [Anaerolineae bacterium]|nr:ROK family protein [Anaerolineae bacterium]HIQ05864.1 ROK family protein [Anaerolineae bacterium]
MNRPLALGVDIGGTKIAIGVVDEDGRLLEHARWATDHSLGPPGILADIVCRARRLLDELDIEPTALTAVGVGCGGPLDRARGRVLSPPNLPGWDDLDVLSPFRDAFGIPAFLENDVNAAAWGEKQFGIGRNVSDMLYVNLGTGIGGGLIVNGRLLHGVGDGAGEIGHTTVLPQGPRCSCGNRGCLEVLASGTGIARRARQVLREGRFSLIRDLAGGELDRVTAQHVLEATRRGDPLACYLWQETVTYIAIAVGNAVSLLAPELIVFGGGVAAAGELLFKPLRKRLARRVRLVPVEHIPIVPASLGDQVGILGAAAIAFSEEHTHNQQ